ncbi:4-hydroxybenzoate octaprenyltransferase [Idiomarina xiamenensis]|uniref:4-hydroxybenzoate octaprenyltransferase n=1 Tax=Idiomarina xiamenensis 10-D-4 TaxID=740709 RepID=K2KV56_9GAMM|nr:4-hydroxybenzoate octaprenyltransferase [Idiomarina xiamenensis]EKE81505.1 4-hydroxybenzoate polyprenyltransferase [Idiomarina xiamenensis 10-D-4]
MNKLSAYWRLMRADRPIGTYLLAWPTLAALLVAAQGDPNLRIITIFMLGTFLMRSAGCVINDIADRRFDGQVERTRQRPLATGEVSVLEAAILTLLLLLLALLLVLQLNTATIQLSFAALAVAALYPLCKRFTQLPQLVLGVAFSFGIPMAFTAQEASLGWSAGLLFFANILWTVAYDTEYAMADRRDDLKIGIKSTAILFGRYDRLIIALLQLLTLLCWLYLAHYLGGKWPLYGSLVVIAGLFLYQHWHIRHRDPHSCFRMFLHNHYVGMALTIGLALHYWS